MSKTVSISAKSEKEAEKEVIRTAAKEGHRNIMINWIRKDVQVGTNESRKVSSTYEISYDYGPHMSKTVSISAKSEKEAEKEVIRTAAKEGHRNIMINWIRKDVQVGTNESETLKVGDTVWAKDQKLSYKTHSGKILSISKETVTIKLKSGATQTFPKKAVSSDFETLNPYKRADESINESHFPQEAVGKSNKKIAAITFDGIGRIYKERVE
jgi:hypothetical protein